MLIRMILFVLAASRVAERSWRWLMVGWAVVSGLHFFRATASLLGQFGRPISFVNTLNSLDVFLWPIMTILLGVLVLAMGIIDSVRGQRRDWLDWTGVVATVAAYWIGQLISRALHIA